MEVEPSSNKLSISAEHCEERFSSNKAEDKADKTETGSVKDGNAGTQGPKTTWWHRERFCGRMERSVVLPVDVDLSKAEASFKDGVLELTFPKTPVVVPEVKKIEIK